MDIVPAVKDISEPTSTPSSDIEGISTVKTRVYKWITGVWTKMHRNNSVAIQQWVDSLPCPETSNGTANSTSVMTSDATHNISPETPPEPNKPMESSVAAPITIPHRMMGYETSVLTDSPRLRKFLYREASMQSDSAGSHSSVESLLESRRADPEAILLSLGFGPSQAQDDLARIPARFLQPSRMRGINTEEFLRQRQRDAETHDNGVHGYRGLTGNPHSPPSTLVAKIMERLRANSERVLMVSPPLSSEHSDHDPEHDRLPE